MEGESASDQLEFEWQFSTSDAAAVAKWLDRAVVPGYSVVANGEKQLHDAYFDTSDWRLNRARFTCRIRSKGESAELTLKGMAEPSGSMRRRREITEPLEPGMGPADAPGPAGQLLRLVAGSRSLERLFTLRTRRRTYALTDGVGTLAEVAVDETMIAVDDAETTPLLRVEVEVEGDAVERAQRFVDLLVAACALRPAGTSKFEAGLQAIGLTPPAATSTGDTAVNASMSAGEAAFAVMRKQFGVMLANEGGTRIGEDVEALHDMRVATRRLRAAMAAFEPFLSARVVAFRAQFGWIAAALGEVRDLDVQLEGIAGWQAEAAREDAAAFGAVAGALRARRVVARRRMLAVLNSRRYEVLVERFEALLRRGPPKSVVPGHLPVLSVAPDLLERRYRRVRRRGDRIRGDSPAADYHALRVDMKKLRYALEFVGPVYGKPTIDFSVRVTAVQDVLGLHQDADVASRLLRELAEQQGRRLPASSVLVMGAMAERYRVQAEKLRRQFPKAYGPLGGGEWRRLKRLVEGRRPVLVVANARGKAMAR